VPSMHRRIPGGTRAAIVRRIRQRTQAQGYPPTLRELAEDVDVSVNVVLQHLRRLRQAGIVTWELGRPRTLRLVEDG
jgi:SOS-response transcriptional repressor LexA